MKKTGFALLWCSVSICFSLYLTGCVQHRIGGDATTRELGTAPPPEVKVTLSEGASPSASPPTPRGGTSLREEVWTLRASRWEPLAAVAAGEEESVAQGPPASSTPIHGNLTLNEDTTWSGEVLVEGSVTIAPKATLTIAPGTTVRVAGNPGPGVIVVQGRISAVGTAAAPVVFAPRSPDNGGGRWQGLVFLASEKKNLLERCRVEGAETGLDLSFSTISVKESYFRGCRTGIRVQDSSIQLSGGGAANCLLGIDLSDGEAEISGGEFTGNRMAITAWRSSLFLSGATLSGNALRAIRAEGSRVRIEGNGIHGNGDGILLSAGEGAVVRNRVSRNGGTGLDLSGSRVRVTGNDISDNGGIGIRVADGMSLAWGNSITGNGRYDIHNAGADDFRAMGNWWGEKTSTGRGGRIHDRASSPETGRVLTLPVLEAKPYTAP